MDSSGPMDSTGLALHIYAGMNKDYLNMDAIHSDETENFVVPGNPAVNMPVTIKIRTGRNNVDGVRLHTADECFDMERCTSEGYFDFYSYTFKYLNQRMDYYFSITKNKSVYYYNSRGLYRDVDSHYNFTVIPGFDVPDWARGAVYYQIYVDRFYNGDPSNDVCNNEYAYLHKSAKHVEIWDQGVANEDICNFYGGDLRGVMEKMTYLKELGVECIYLNPVFVSPSNHKYDIQDYDYIDPHYGVIVEDGGEPLYFEKFNNRYASMYIQRTTNTINLEASNKLMADLISLAHANGIKVILDGVFNHCGAFNKWLDKEGFYAAAGYPAGAYREENSPYHDYFKWYDKNWPNNDCYDSWWGHDNHPKLNYETSEELYNYILDIGRKWVSPPFNADGWRLDVAADLGSSPELNHRFWRDFRQAVKSANPQAVILAEHYGDASSWLTGDQWDTIMNYDAFMEPITWFLTGVEKHSEDFKRDLLCNSQAFEAAMRYHGARMSNLSLHSAMNGLSNHDHSRFLTRTNMRVGRLHTVGADAADTGINRGIMMEAVIFQMTWPGSPTVYYGDEAGLTGWTDPDNRRTYPWGYEDMVLLNLHREAIKLRRQYTALRHGSLAYLFMDYGVISYARWDENDTIVVILNNNCIERTLPIPVWVAGVAEKALMKVLLYTSTGGYGIGHNEYRVNAGIVRVMMQPYSSIILHYGG